MFSKLLIVMIAVTVAINAQTTAPTTTSDVVDGPSATPVLTPCMTECFTAVAAADGCGTFLNITCVCTSAQFQVDADFCLSENCAPPEVQAGNILLNNECVAADLSDNTGNAIPNTTFTLPGVSSTSTTSTSTTVITSASSSNNSAGTPTNSTSSSSPPTSSNESTSLAAKLAIIFGSILGTFVFLIILCALWYLFRCRPRTQPSAIGGAPVRSAIYPSNPISSFQPNAMNNDQPQMTNPFLHRYEPNQGSTNTEGLTLQMSMGDRRNLALPSTSHQPTAEGSNSALP